MTKLKKKELGKIFKKIKREDKDFVSRQKVWKKFEQNNETIALNVLFSSKNNEEITLVYKSEHNFEQENNVVLLMINDGAEKYYYFAVKKIEFHSSELLKNKKEAIINGDNCFQNALNDAVDYERVKKDPQKYQKLSQIFVSIIGKI